MHSHPANKGQPSVSSQGVFSSHTPDISPSPASGTHQVNSAYIPNKSPSPLHCQGGQSSSEQGFSASWVEQLQLALAIANPELLQQLVLHCQSPLVSLHQLGAISAAVSVPVDGSQAADSVLSVEVISCQLSPGSDIHRSDKPDKTVKSNAISLDSAVHSSQNSAAEAIAQQRALVTQICRETKLQTLGMNIPLPEAIALLQYATFSLPDIQRILNLPYNGWHRSWWSMVDSSVEQTLGTSGVAPVGFTIPFKRLIRSRRYADGTVMLQYKDQFAHIPPPCFRTQQQSVLVHIQRPNQSVSDILAWMNHARITLKADHGLLLYHQLSPLEQQALSNQGIYLYHCASAEPIPPTVTPSPVMYRDRAVHELSEHEVMPGGNASQSEAQISGTMLADCRICRQHYCPMHGAMDSPVMACRLFGVD